jgi:hypothetical protein
MLTNFMERLRINRTNDPNVQQIAYDNSFNTACDGYRSKWGLSFNSYWSNSIYQLQYCLYLIVLKLIFNQIEIR